MDKQKEFQRRYYDSYHRRPRNLRNLESYLQKRGKKILDNVRAKPGMKILDVGCGDGIFARFFRNSLNGDFSYIGTDISIERCCLGKDENPEEDFIQSQAELLPFKDESFDLVFANGLLHHVPDYKRVLEEMWRVCKNGGVVVLIEPNRYFPGFALDALIRKLERGILRVSVCSVAGFLSTRFGLKKWRALPVNTYTFPYRSFPPAVLFPLVKKLEDLFEKPFISTNFMFVAEKEISSPCGGEGCVRSEIPMRKNEREVRRKKVLALLIRGLITFLLLFLIIYKIGWSKITSAFSAVNVKYLIFAFAFTFPAVVLKATKWFLVLRRELPRVRWTRALKSLLFGYGVGAISPVRLGEIARILFFPGDKKYQTAGLVLVDKVFDFLALIFLSTIGVAYFWGIKFGLLPLALCIIGLCFVSFPTKSHPFLEKMICIMPFKEKMQKLIRSYEVLFPKLVLTCFGVAVFGFILSMFQFYFLVTAFTGVSPQAIAVSLPLIVLSNIVPVGIGNIGVRESVAALVFSYFHIPSEIAVSSAFLLFVMDIVLPGMVGAVFMPALKHKEII